MLITADALSFEYPGIRALNNVSFSVHERSITALVGRTAPARQLFSVVLQRSMSRFQGLYSLRELTYSIIPASATGG